MEHQRSGLSAAQWSVMECLWQTGALTGREAVDAMAEKMGWSRSTTLTLLRRMEEKGIIESSVVQGVKTFCPVLRRDEAALIETESLLERVYNGSISMLVSAMTHKHTLSRQEIDRLYALLDGLEVEDRDPVDR